MLRNSFLHIPGIGQTTERKIWESGVACWDEFSSCPPDLFSRKKSDSIIFHLDRSALSARSGDVDYFFAGLPAGDQWRVFGEFRDSCAYVDIETTGLGGPGDSITTIALYDGESVRCYVQGENLNDFMRDISRYSIIVTYNGKTFDVPFINRYFGVSLPHAHLDLRYILHSLGYRGGLKSCERQLGLGRYGAMAEVDGFFAVILWNEYNRTGNRRVLETLLAYNIADTVNLEFLMVKAYNLKVSALPISVSALTQGEGCRNPFQVDSGVVSSLQMSNW